MGVVTMIITTVLATGTEVTAAAILEIRTSTHTATKRPVVSAQTQVTLPNLPLLPRIVPAHAATLILWVMAIAMIATTTAGATMTEVIAVEPMGPSGNIRTARIANVKIQTALRRPSPSRRHQLRHPSALASVASPNSNKMAAVTMITITVAAIGTAEIAVALPATKINGFTVQNASVRILLMTPVLAAGRAVRPHLSATAIVMTTTITVAANMMVAIAVVKMVTNTSMLTVPGATAKTRITPPRLIVMANAVCLITQATADVMTVTIIVLVDGILATAVENLGTSGNIRIASSVTAKIPKYPSKRSVLVIRRVRRCHTLGMVAATIITTTAVVVGIMVTVAGVLATRGNSFTVKSVSV